MHRSACAAVRPVSLPTATTVAHTMPPSDTQPLTFQRLPVGGHIDRVESLTNATADEMREILEVLNDGDADAERRAAAAHEAAEKRRKHREAMVLFRLRKKTNFGDMRKQEQSLQEVLQHELKEYRQLRERRSAVSPNQQDEATMRKLQDEFADILMVKESLLRENRAMEGVINELAKFQKLVMDEVERQAVDDENAASAENASPNVAREPKHPSASGGYWVKLLENEPSVFFVPEPEENHEQLARTSFQRAMHLHSGFVHKRFDYTETFCLGWRAQHSLIGTPGSKRMLRFRFTRQVPRWFMSIDDYQRLAWPVVNTPELNARLYSTPVLMKVVQWVNDHTFVTFRNSPHRDRKMNYRYFASNSQIEFRDDQHRRAYMIHHTILDREPPLVEAAAKQPIVWIKEGSQCMKFTEIDENDAIEIDHYGYMNCVSEEQARYLMIETCSILMRWERMVVPPRLLTPE